MNKKSKKESLPKDMTLLARRIVLLAKLLWNGNKSRMANELVISLSVMSRVLRGEQEPPAKLLDALARWPGVNVRWLFAGEGEPLSERNLGAGGGRFLPIAKLLLPGPPGDHPELLTWTSLPVADALYSETAYWLCVPSDHLIVTDKAAKTERVKAGDYLLIETATNWTRKLDAVAGRLCAVRVPSSQREEVILTRVADEPDEFEPFYAVETFSYVADARLVLDDDSTSVIELVTKGTDFRFRTLPAWWSSWTASLAVKLARAGAEGEVTSD